MARKDRLIQEYVHDPYFMRGKYHGPSLCKKCGVAFCKGIFEWLKPIPENAKTMICPACRRIGHKYEGGIVYLQSEFLSEHKDEIMSTIKNTEAHEMKYRPLERIMDITEEKRKLVVRTTCEHLARRIGDPIRRAYKGDLKIQYLQGEKYVRIWWNR